MFDDNDFTKYLSEDDLENIQEFLEIYGEESVLAVIGRGRGLEILLTEEEKIVLSESRSDKRNLLIESF